MGWHIQAGRKTEKMGYGEYVYALRDIAHDLDPEHEAEFDKLPNITPNEWSNIVRQFKPELYLLNCVSDQKPYTTEEAKQIADFLEKITTPTERVKKLQNIFFHARRYRANVYFM